LGFGAVYVAFYRMWQVLKTYWQGLLHLFYPRLCLSCGRALMKGEDMVCTHCMYQLQRTNYHLDKENPVAQLFYGRVSWSLPVLILVLIKAAFFSNSCIT